MKVTIKIIKGKSKKYNNKVFTFENCIKNIKESYVLKLEKCVSMEVFSFKFEFNNKIYNGRIENDYNFGWRCQLNGVNNIGTINFDEIEILKIN